MVPMFNSSKERVDSAFIKEGKFMFNGIADVPEVYILRTKPVLRLTLQELLIVKESGTLMVNIGENSSVTGTTLNDKLQVWKEFKIESDSITFSLQQQYEKADDSVKSSIIVQSDSLNQQIVNYHFNFVKMNKENVVGRMVSQMVGNSFTPEQKNELGLE